MINAADSAPPALLHLEDLQVGQIFESKMATLDEGQIKAFATHYDPQFFHLDPIAARASLFGGLAASGWQVAAVTMRLLVESNRIAGGIIGAGAEIAWPRPTRPGDALTVRSEILDIKPSRSRQDRGIVTLQSVTRNQDNEVVQTLVSKLVVFRRSPAIEAASPHKGSQKLSSVIIRSIKAKLAALSALLLAMSACTTGL